MLSEQQSSYRSLCSMIPFIFILKTYKRVNQQEGKVEEPKNKGFKTEKK